MEPTGTRRSRHYLNWTGAVRRGITQLGRLARLARLDQLPRLTRLARLGRLAPRRVAKFWIGALALALALLCASAVGLGATFASTDNPTMRTGLPVPGDQQQAINVAAQSCPTLAPARLAGQLMAESAFDQGATTKSGGHGVGGLTDAVWARWLPAADAPRSDAKANIVALAHYMCDLIGQVRVAKVPGDGWRDALAAYRSGLDAVVKAGGVPAGATGYVDLVAAYAAWYAQAAAPAPATTQGRLPAPTAGGRGPAKPIPAAYLAEVIAAGRTCSTITATRVAAQLMAASAFQPNLVGPTGAQGIAQFLPELWRQYAPTPAATPWDPSTAIPALSSAMCDLSSQLSLLGGDPYALALAAFQWGPLPVREAGGATATATLQSYIRTVQGYEHAYATDPKLSNGELAAPPPPAPVGPVGAFPTPPRAVIPTNGDPTHGTTNPTHAAGNPTHAAASPKRAAAAPKPAAPAWTTLTVTATKVLERGQSVHSNRTELIMEQNGNLDIYDENHKLRWSSGTSGRGGYKTVFQADGNLAVYDANGQSLWTSNTPGRDGAVLVLERDGNVCVVYQGIVVWAANTAH